MSSPELPSHFSIWGCHAWHLCGCTALIVAGVSHGFELSKQANMPARTGTSVITVNLQPLALSTFPYAF